MRRMVQAAGLLLICTALAAVAVAADVTGTWKSKMETPRGTTETDFVLKQEGEKLTGKAVTARGEAELKEGSVNGDTVQFTVERRFGQEGRVFTLVYKAKVVGGKLEGTVQVGDQERPFTATRAQ
jgi:hypothetical protein